MRLVFIAERSSEVHPQDILDYHMFRTRLRADEPESDLHMAERFHAARMLFERGNEHVYHNSLCRVEDAPRDSQAAVTADLCGIIGDDMTLVFCETTPPTSKFLKVLRLVERASNARALVMYPSSIGLPRAMTSGSEHRKLDVAFIPWFDDEHVIDAAFREVFEMVKMLSNQTRMRMLTPLLERQFRKRDYRRVINAKLLYENLATLTESGMIEEAEDESYKLTQLGSSLIGEYLAFLERVRRVMKETSETRRR